MRSRSQTPMPSEDVAKVRARNRIVFNTLTVPLMVTVLGGGLIGLFSVPSISPKLILLGTAAGIMTIVAAAAGYVGGVDWASMYARTRALYRIQIFALGTALVALFICLLGATGTLAFGGLQQPKDQPSPPNKKHGQVPPNANEVEPTDATASDQSPPHEDNSGNYFTYEPENAIDDHDGTAWRVPGDGKGQWIQVNYTRQVKVSAVGVIPGHDKIDPADGTDRFYQLYVVRQAKIEFSDGTSVEADFERDRSVQFVYLDPAKRTKRVRIEIQDTYPPGDNPNGQQYPYLVHETAISEIEVK